MLTTPSKARMWTFERLIQVNPLEQDKVLTELESYLSIPIGRDPFGKLFFLKGIKEEMERQDRNERALKKRRPEQDFESGPAIDTLVSNLGLYRMSIQNEGEGPRVKLNMSNQQNFSLGLNKEGHNIRTRSVTI